MAPPTLNKAPTEYQELRLLETMYMSLDVPDVKCFLYVPKTFPLRRPQSVTFDFARHAKGALTIGVCIGGTTILDGWDAKVELLIQGLVKETADYHRANVACSQILRALVILEETYPELPRHDISFNVHISGYSLGGLFAQATTVLLMNDWARSNRHSIACRTYECPGVQDHYHQMALNCFNGRSAPWKEIIINYKSMPGPFNTVFKDIGRVIHLYDPDNVISDEAWIASCISGTVMRAGFWAPTVDAFLGNPSEKKANEDDGLESVALGLTLLLKVGLDVADVLRNHRVSTMLENFDRSGAFLPGVRIEMAQWPVYQGFNDAARMLDSGGSAMVPFSEDNAGLHTLFFFGGKQGYLERKLANLPGYQRATR